VLTGAGIAEPEARRFFGKLLADNGLEAKDLLQAIASCADSGSPDPRAILSKWAGGIAKRREPVERKRVGFV